MMQGVAEYLSYGNILWNPCIAIRIVSHCKYRDMYRIVSYRLKPVSSHLYWAVTVATILTVYIP